MGRFDGVLFCSDFDGTMAHDAKVSDTDADAIRYFQSEGGIFVPASGRPAHFFPANVPSVVASKYIIGLNGAEILDVERGSAVYRGKLNKPQAMAITGEFLCGYEEVLNVYVHTADSGNHFTADTWEKESPLLEGDVYKMVFVVENGSGERMVKALSNMVPSGYLVERSWHIGIELIADFNTKGVAVSRLKAMLGDRARLVVCAGDFENDISMIKFADIGYAVANAAPLVLEAADRITASVRENAIAHIIDELQGDVALL